MYLSRLEMFGFKSFAERIDLQLTPGITAVVGPNGSGKSNVADAIRWVLGEQSAKSLRGGKMEDVIFQGSEKRKALSFCEVTLVFNNEDRALPVDFAEVSVTRRLYRSGESEYLLNKTTCRLKDVIELFLDTGIGKEGYSIIGQGKIDSIISYKTEERRAIFEEAAGIAKFKSKKAEAERRLAHTRDNLERLGDIIAELSGRLEPLSGQAAVATEFLALREELRAIEVNFYLYQYDMADKRKQSSRESLQAVAGEIEEKAALSCRLQGESQALEETLAQIEARIGTLHGEILQKASALEGGLGDLRVLNERAAHLEEEAARAKAELADRGDMQKSLAAALDGDKQAARQRQEQLFARRQQLQEKERLLAAESARLEEEAQALEQEKTAVFARLNRLTDVKSSLGRSEAMQQALEDRLLQLAGQKEELAKKKNNLAGALAQMETEEKALAAALQAARLAGEQARDALLQAARAEEERTEKVQAARMRLQSVQARRGMLLDMKKDYEGYGYSVKQILAICQKEPTYAQLCIGAVAGLISVEGRLEKAVEMALGPAMQHLVTPHEEAAKILIELLRARKLGRATFLPLTALRSRGLNNEERALLSAPGCLGVAADLVDFNPAYKDIFGNLLGRTVICETLDAAIALARRARHTFKVVTLEGDIVNAGGSMTGGSAGKLTSLLGRDREIDKAASEIAALTQEIEKLQAAKAEALTQKGAQTSALAAQDARLREMELEKARSGERLQKLRADMEGMAAQEELFATQGVQMRETLAEIAAEIQKYSGAQGEIEASGENAQAEIASRQADLSRRKLQRDKRADAITEEKILLAALENELQTLAGSARRMEEEMARAGERKIQLEAKQGEVAEGKRRLEEESLILSRRLDGLKKEKAELEEALAKKEGEKEETSLRLRENARRVKDLETDVAAARERTIRLEMTLQKVDSDIAVMEQRIWDEYQLTYQLALEFKQEGFAVTGVQADINRRRRAINDLGNVNVNAIEEFVTCKERYENLLAQQNDLEKAEQDLHKIIAELSRRMEKQFKEQFALINQYFGQTFKDLFGGGRAELRMEEGNVLESGIEIVAQPPGKTLQLLSLLSGGERALTAVAILFAMLLLKPTPFCLLDEVETALDDSNTYNLAAFLRDYSAKTQFIVITHKKPTMEQADRLYGIAMEEKGVSKTVTVKLSDY